MKALLIAAGIAAATLGAAAPAEAQWHNDRHHSEVRYHNGGHDRGWNHGGNRGWDRGHRGYRHASCWTEWRHHHRVRICR